ncbi:MAG TPA: hypothetical protein VF800_00725 [Telluria sp.]
MAPFVQRAREHDCAEYFNRLVVFDRKYVLSAVRGICTMPDNPLKLGRYTLYGATPDVVLCSGTDGRFTHTCTDPAMLPLFQRMTFAQKSVPDSFDGISVQEVLFLPKEGSLMPLSPLERDNASRIQAPRQMVIRDAATLAAVWAEHNAGKASPAPLPKVVFKNEMVIALFGGGGGSCHSVTLRSVRVSGDKLVAAYQQGDATKPGTVCIGLPATPMEMVVIDRSDAPVVFEKVQPDDVAFRPFDLAAPLAIEPRQVVVKDAASLTALLKDTYESSARPVVDFSKQMVVASYLGQTEHGGFSIDIGSIERIGGKLRVTTVVSTLGRYNQGAPVMESFLPVAIAVFDKSDAPVEFVTQISYSR